jgi:hypothetical protein
MRAPIRALYAWLFQAMYISVSTSKAVICVLINIAQSGTTSKTSTPSLIVAKPFYPYLLLVTPDRDAQNREYNERSEFNISTAIGTTRPAVQSHLTDTGRRRLDKATTAERQPWTPRHRSRRCFRKRHIHSEIHGENAPDARTTAAL